MVLFIKILFLSLSLFVFTIENDNNNNKCQLLFQIERIEYAGEESGKSCCGVMVTQTVSIRWFIVMIAFVGICCAVVGTVLGAMRSSGREHITVSLLMIGKLFIAIIDQTRTIEK